MFADDTNFFLSDENIGKLFKQMNNKLKSVSTWFKTNKLSINIDKNQKDYFLCLQNFQNYSLMA